MARTRGGINNAARRNIFNNRRFAAAKKTANLHRRNCEIKIKFLLTQSKRVQVKHRGNVTRKMTIRRHTVYPARRRNREF